MEINSDYVGTLLKEYRKEITWQETMNYAAALGDNNPLYFDDERPEGIIAHPMFCVAVTWPISERIWEYMEDIDFPKEILLTQVHYTEHLQIHRLIRPGDLLTVRGRVVATLPHKAGTLFFVRFDASDGQEVPVFTEHMGGLMRGVRCTDGGRRSEQLPQVPKHSGEETFLWESAAFVDRMAPFIYDGCTGIHFPIHTSVKFARAVGLPDIIHQGTATLALAVREVINREVGSDPQFVRSIACRFTGMVIPGSEIRIRLAGRESSKGEDHLFFHVLNQEGKKAVSEGIITLKVSSGQDVVRTSW
jgi:acyl dehydratase